MALADYVHRKPTIETGRLVLRPMGPGDVPALAEWMGDRAMYEFWGKGPGRAEKNPSLLFEKAERAAKSFHLGIAGKAEGKVVGDVWVYLIENDRMAQVAVRVGRAWQGKGYGTEALGAMTRFCFEHTELRRLWTKVDVRNAASCRMLEKCGYRREGLVRQGKMVSTWCDYYIYGILAEDVRGRDGYAPANGPGRGFRA